jgi:DNA-directed RNA polymerase specialized sigma24 family protein
MGERELKEFTGEGLMLLIREAGPVEAFNKLIVELNKTTKAKIVRYLRYRSCIDPVEHGEDIVQETWINVVEDLEKFRSGTKQVQLENPLGWIFQIGRNVCNRHIKEECKVLKTFADIEVIDESTLKFRKVLLPPAEDIEEVKTTATINFEDIEDEMRWDESFRKTSSKLAKMARQAKREITGGKSEDMDYEKL